MGTTTVHIAGADDQPARYEPGRTQEMLAALLAGRPEAERWLAEVVGGWLEARARSHPLGRALGVPSADVVQEVWLRVLSSRALERFTYRGPGSLGRYLGRWVDRVLLDHARRAGAAKRIDPADLCGLEELGAGSDPALADARCAPSGRMRCCELQRLCAEIAGERAWRALVLSRIEGRGAAAAGRELGVSASRVRGLVREAREALRRALGEAPA